VTSAVRGGALELTVEEYLLAWQHLRLGLVHWNLQPPGGSHLPSEKKCTVEERMVAQRQAWEALRARGLAGTRQLAPDLEDALHLVARPAVELNARLDLPDGKLTVVGCARGEHAAVAELCEGCASGPLGLLPCPPRWPRSSPTGRGVAGRRCRFPLSSFLITKG
jgi:hypothetical protein